MRQAKARIKGLPFTILLVLLLGAQPIATDLYLPALPEIGRELGAAGSSLTLFMLAFGVGQLINGPLADRFGRRPMLLLGLVLYALAALGAAFSLTLTSLASCRAIQGFAMAAVMVCIRAAVRDLYAAHEGPRIMAWGLSGLGVVALLAPLLGAVVVQNFSWRWALLCMALYACLVLIYCVKNFTETRPSQVGQLPGGVREVLKSRSFWAWTGLASTTFSAQFCFLLLSPAIYIDYLGLSPLAYGWVPASGSLAYVIGTTGCRHLLRRHTALRMVQGGSVLSLTGGLVQLTAIFFTPHSLPLLLVGHWIYALGHGIHQPCGQAGAVGEFPHLAGRAVAWSGFVMMLLAFLVGQTANYFMNARHTLGALPLIIPMLVAGTGLVWIAFGWLPTVVRAAEPAKATVVTNDKV